MLLNRDPSWLRGCRPQPVGQAQDLSEQGSGDSDLRKSERDVATVAHDLRADLGGPFVQRGSPPGRGLMSLRGPGRVETIFWRSR